MLIFSHFSRNLRPVLSSRMLFLLENNLKDNHGKKITIFSPGMMSYMFFIKEWSAFKKIQPPLILNQPILYIDTFFLFFLIRLFILEKYIT